MAERARAEDEATRRLRALPHMRSLLVAELSSSLGSTMALLGIAYLSYDASRSVLHTVLVSAAYSLPMATFGMVAGRLAQRVERRLLLVGCYGAKILLYSAMAALAAAGELGVPELMVAAVLAGTTSAFTTPAWMEYERDLVPADRLAEVNGALGGAAAAAGLAGSVLGGALMSAVGVWSVFALDAASYLPYVWVIFRTRVPGRSAPTTGRISFRQTTAYVRAHPALWQAFGRIALLSLLVAPVVQLLPAVASQISASRSTLGTLTAFYGVGAMSVAWVIHVLERRFAPQRIIDVSFLATSAILLAFGLFGDPLDPPVVWGFLAASLVPLGLLLSLGQSVIASIVQVRVEEQMEGPVFALYAIVYTLVAPAGGLALGWVADTRAVWTAVTVAGVGMVALTAVLWSRQLLAARAEAPPEGPLHHRATRFRLHHAQSGAFPLVHHEHVRRAAAAARGDGRPAPHQRG
ncbi:MFS transporter [Iamia majanohamensis]|uniref:MFS transporter n=1 Tax=Iamia majanohamensis TaxID=467976 RepID=A0AAE9Y552_9ACTN|nr:MFS transporter [Iamia majanohamensis]WCO66540.1 MFS transporter [Iamia majanohamensis]